MAWVACLHGLRASVGGMGDVLAWVAWKACLREWRDSVGSVGGVLAWGGVLTWVTWLAF